MIKTVKLFEKLGCILLLTLGFIYLSVKSVGQVVVGELAGAGVLLFFELLILR